MVCVGMDVAKDKLSIANLYKKAVSLSAHYQ